MARQKPIEASILAFFQGDDGRQGRLQEVVLYSHYVCSGLDHTPDPFFAFSPLYTNTICVDHTKYLAF